VNAHEPPRKLRRLTSESRVIRSGALGGKIDGRSAEGRFLAKCERELTAQLMAEPSFTQTMLIACGPGAAQDRAARREGCGRELD
jgi:hypothetical protein